MSSTIASMATATATAVAATIAKPATPIAPAGIVAIAVSFAFGFIATVAIVMRTFIKLRITRTFGWNDVGILTALVAYHTLGGLLIFGVLNGIGGPISKSTVAGITNVLKSIWFLEIIYVILTSIMKASIAITMMRWCRDKKWLTNLFWGSIALDVLISSIFTLYVIFQCQPVAYAWELLDPTKKGKCLPFTGQVYMGYALSFVTIILDVLLMTAPFIIMKGKGLSKRLKMYIFGLFGLGIAASIANVIRLLALIKLSNPVGDKLLNAAPVFTYSAIEVSIGLIVAGFIEFGPLLAKYNFKGFEYYSAFAELDDDMNKPINLQTFEKDQPRSITHPMTAASRRDYAREQEMAMEMGQGMGGRI